MPKVFVSGDRLGGAPWKGCSVLEDAVVGAAFSREVHMPVKFISARQAELIKSRQEANNPVFSLK